MKEFDELRIPSPLDPSASAYKDWLHLNLFDHQSGTVGLVNVSLHGSFDDARSRAVGTSLFHTSDGLWHGNLEITGLDEAAASPAGVALPEVALLIDPPRKTLHASSEQPSEGVRARLSASLFCQPRMLEFGQPFGSGWIAWYVAPRVRLNGKVEIAGTSYEVSEWSGYHDHNWGRWRWGDDVGWEWGVFACPEPGPTIVFCRLTNRLHSVLGPAQLIFVGRQRTRTFPDAAIKLRLEGLARSPQLRLPGALAALHSDRREPDLPSRIEIEAATGLDWVRLAFDAEGSAQLIEGETTRPGYSFIHEIAGRFTIEGKVCGLTIEDQGLGVFEHVG